MRRLLFLHLLEKSSTRHLLQENESKALEKVDGMRVAKIGTQTQATLRSEGKRRLLFTFARRRAKDLLVFKQHLRSGTLH